MTAVRKISVKSVALPAEHGGWSFWLEPALLGILVASSAAAWYLALASLAAFLAHQPLKILLIDLRRGKSYDRTRLALRFLGLYGAIVLAVLLIIILLAGIRPLIPLAVAAAMAAVQISYDLRHESRHWLAEVLGASAMSLTATSIALAAGWDMLPALSLAAIIVLRAVPAVFYVRARLLLEKGKSADSSLSTLSHLLAFFALAFLSIQGLVPVLSAVMGLILLGRAAWGLSRFRRIVPARYIGIQEVVYGLMTVILAAVGYSL